MDEAAGWGTVLAVVFGPEELGVVLWEEELSDTQNEFFHDRNRL